MNPKSSRNLRLTRQPFRDTVADGGLLQVPLQHGAPDGRSIELGFVRLEGRATPAGAPVVFLTGGPGLSGIRAGQGRLYPLFDSLRDRSDVILLDQRAYPPSDPPTDKPIGHPFPTDRAVTREEYLRSIAHTVRGEAAKLVAKGISLEALNTNESADDVAALVRALYGNRAGTERSSQPRVALLGWSYGSHLAMAVIKRHEALVASVVLAAPEGPDHTYKRPIRIQEHLERIAERVRARAAPGESPFDLVATLARVLERLEREPVRVTMRRDELEGVADAPYEVVIGRFDLEWIISEGLADPRVLRRLPVWLSRMERGDFSMIGTERLLRGSFEALRFELPHTVHRYCMDCASGATAKRRAQIDREVSETLLGRTIDFPLPEICDALGCPDLGDEFRAPPRSRVPVLFITGTLDCRTPAENVADLAPGFSNHRHVVVEDAGHGDLLLQSRVQGAITRFFEDGNVESERVNADEVFSLERETS